MGHKLKRSHRGNRHGLGSCVQSNILGNNGIISRPPLQVDAELGRTRSSSGPTGGAGSGLVNVFWPISTAVTTASTLASSCALWASSKPLSLFEARLPDSLQLGPRPLHSSSPAPRASSQCTPRSHGPPACPASPAPALEPVGLTTAQVSLAVEPLLPQRADRRGVADHHGA